MKPKYSTGDMVIVIMNNKFKKIAILNSYYSQGVYGPEGYRYSFLTDSPYGNGSVYGCNEIWIDEAQCFKNMTELIDNILSQTDLML